MKEILVKRLTQDAIIPTKANNTDAGWDLYSSEEKTILAKNRAIIKTGISVEIPEEHVGLIWPRSGLSVKQGIDVLAGVVDSGYRGEIMVCLYNTSNDDVFLSKGSRIAQILFQEVPSMILIEAQELTNSDRGKQGFGSSGR